MTPATWEDPLAPPTALRTVGPSDAPYPGTVRAGLPSRLWVDVEEFAGSPLWSADPDGHLLAPLDVARTADGHAVLLPLCPERLRAQLDRSAPLTPGEAVNVAVSLVRGAAEARRHELSTGIWWVTDDGRPVLAATGTTPWRDETAAVLQLLAGEQDPAVSPAFQAAAALVSDLGAPSRRWLECEDALLAVAAPAPLTPGHLPMPARRSVVSRLPEPAAAAEPVGALAALIARVAGAFDAEWTDRVRSSLPRLRPTPTGPAAGRMPVIGAAVAPAASSRSRRLPVLVGAAVAAVVLICGFLWPDDEPTAADPGDAPTASASSPSPAAPAATAPADADATAAVAPSALPMPEIARRLLDRLAQCLAAEADCAAVHEDPSRPIPAGIATLPTAERELAVLDEYGGVAVLRATARNDDVPAQIVVIVRDGGGWLVRDIYDIADQP